jgi:hypothetical protein
MVLMKPGCWHDTAWADRSWPEDLWLEYGTATAPAAALPTGSHQVITWQPIRVKEDLLQPEKSTVEVILQPLLTGMTFEELVAYAHEMLSVEHATEEDFQRILEPVLDLKQESEKDALVELRRLLIGFKSEKELFRNGLRKILKEKN